MPPQWRRSPHHQSAKVSSKCLLAKDHLEGTKVAVFPSLRPTESPAAQRTGGHRGVTTRKTTGDLATRMGQATRRRQVVGYGQRAPEEGTCPGVRCRTPRRNEPGKPSLVTLVQPRPPCARSFTSQRQKKPLQVQNVLMPAVVASSLRDCRVARVLMGVWLTSSGVTSRIVIGCGRPCATLFHGASSERRRADTGKGTSPIFLHTLISERFAYFSRKQLSRRRRRPRAQHRVCDGQYGLALCSSAHSCDTQPAPLQLFSWVVEKLQARPLVQRLTISAGTVR